MLNFREKIAQSLGIGSAPPNPIQEKIGISIISSSQKCANLLQTMSTLLTHRHFCDLQSLLNNHILNSLSPTCP